VPEEKEKARLRRAFLFDERRNYETTKLQKQILRSLASFRMTARVM